MSIYAKSVSFLAKGVNLSTVIKSCRANFVQKCQFWEKKLNFVRNVDFFKQVCTTTESEHLIGKHAYFQKIVTFCVIKKLSNSDKNFNFS